MKNATPRPFRAKKSAAGLVATLRKDEHAPFSAMLEVADRCNEVCVHCYQIQGQKGELDTHDWQRIMDELADMGVLFLTISGGEATLRRDFLALIRYARSKRFAVKLFTNGLNMTDALAQALADEAVQEVQISLYSHRSEVHDWVTRVPGSWAKTVAGAEALIRSGVKVVLKSPMMSINADDFDAYVAFVTGLGADYSMDPHLDPREDGDRDPERLRVEYQQWVRVRDKLNNGDVPQAAGPSSRRRQLSSSVCGACSGHVHIEANGELRPCTQMSVPVGHALRDGVRQAWENNPDGAMIRQLTWGHLHGCRECDLRAHCGRCFANALAESGDAMGPYETACTYARRNYAASFGSEIEVTNSQDVRRTTSLGPYREVAPGVIDLLPDRVCSDDEQLRRRHPWVRRNAAAMSDRDAEPVVPGQLVQIRRPGAKRAHLEQVPFS